MTLPLAKPPRKNPVLATRQATLPPPSRSRVALGLTAAASRGRFALQVCAECAMVQYPPREACVRCLSSKLPWRDQSGRGSLVSATTLHHSNDPFFRERLPWRLGLVQLDTGPTLICHLHGDVTTIPARVVVTTRLDRSGQAVLVALPDPPTENMRDDPMMREMSCDPRFRKILVSDGKSAVGQALVRALADAGADLIWVGYAEPWKKLPGFDALATLPRVVPMPLDLTSQKSVDELGGALAGKVDIVINNAEVHRGHGIASRRGTDVARMEMDVNYFGLLRLAQAFGPALKGRAADGQSNAIAWVNLLSIYALSSFPAHGTYSASKAAAHSLSQCLRSEFRPAGIRVVDVFAGPIDDEWNQLTPPPKLAPATLAATIVRALRDGIEDVYPGDVAQEWYRRWRDDPKVLERELAAGDGR